MLGTFRQHVTCGMWHSLLLTRRELHAGLATATIWPVAVLNCATLIDSAWDVACLRAESGGKLLANMMAARLHGDRPVVLLGVSIGARLVYYCLLELYKLGARTLPSCIVDDGCYMYLRDSCQLVALQRLDCVRVPICFESFRACVIQCSFNTQERLAQTIINLHDKWGDICQVRDTCM